MMKPEKNSISPSDDEARWAAVVARDCAADDRFWYAVSTTGIYCRPSCPARRAKREHGRVYDSSEEAESGTGGNVMNSWQPICQLPQIRPWHDAYGVMVRSRWRRRYS
ncbi:MAG: Ada metal-binding domain-containing protein [Burkholderiales bacterium]